MRVLAISTWWPEPADNGSRLRIARLLGALSETHELHLVALQQQSATAEQQARLRERCASVVGLPERHWTPQRRELIRSLWHAEPASVRATYHRELAELVQRQAAAIRPELVIAFQLGAAPYARLVSTGARVLEEVEVTRILEQWTRQRQPLRKLRAWLTWHKQRRYVQALLHDFDACTVVSAAEQAAVRALAPAGMPIAVVPNGADVAATLTSAPLPEPDTLIYPGALSYDANYDAMQHFVHAILPRIRAQRPQVRLLITGHATAEQRAALRADGVEWTGYVPDVRPLVARAWGEVVPLRLGGGTRLKVLEALALGTPIISTAKGVEGLDLQPEQHLLLADAPDDFARATLRLLREPALRARLAAAGQQVVRERYDWRQIGGQFRSMLAETVAARGLG